MAHDGDLEAAAAAQYHAVQGDPSEHEASGRRFSRDGLLCALGCLLVVLVVSIFISDMSTLGERLHHHDFDAFSVRLSGHEGIEPASPAAVVSPVFRVTLRTMDGACVDRAVATVLYSGVALGWGRAAPLDCAARRRERDVVELVARGQGVGLSERLRGRMASEWRRSGALELDVDVRIFDEETYPIHVKYRYIPNRVVQCKFDM
ncbi:hypothetical protein GUJ93_ZPchr0001g29783 [Zizania palustris]|uniref:Uncharacterized protein n=1 Tax=Zizania palustris TaxID=103762 RepID=A0A8J5RXC0_ZIZPA|nr:hypothetical protein GUJ93_ZPchr0001g29783 [Zizania palustris]